MESVIVAARNGGLPKRYVKMAARTFLISDKTMFQYGLFW
jgi:hypothetical protein